MSSSAETSRRTLLVGAAGGVVALIAQALGRPAPARAASGTFDSPFAETPAVTAVATAMGGTGVKGSATDQFGSSKGVHGVTASESGVGVLGTATNDHNAAYGVSGETVSALGAGVVGRNTAAGIGTGVRGESSGASGIGVLGRSSVGGVGVSGESAGIGGMFNGGTAQLRLVPAASPGKPTTGSHKKGEVYMDSKSSLFLCTADGTPGTWKKVLTKLV